MGPYVLCEQVLEAKVWLYIEHFWNILLEVPYRCRGHRVDIAWHARIRSSISLQNFLSAYFITYNDTYDQWTPFYSRSLSHSRTVCVCECLNGIVYLSSNKL